MAELIGDCQLWQKGCTTKGYGETFVNGRVVYAHRVAYEAVHGPLGDLTIHHLCGQTRCCNPEHMRPMARRDHAGAGGHGKLTFEDAQEIRLLALAGWKQREIACLYDISRPHVSYILSGREWVD